MNILLYMYGTMQLACLLSGLFMITVSAATLWQKQRKDTIYMPRWYLGLSAGLLGWLSVVSFVPRLLVYAAYDLNLDHIYLSATLAMMLLFGTNAVIFCIVTHKPRRALNVFLLILAGSFLAQFLESL